MRANVAVKAFIVGVVAAAFIVPLGMIWRVVKDRSRYRDTVVAEVARSTAQSQTLVGPLVVVRYREYIPAAVKGEAEQIREGVDVLLPDSLQIRSNARVDMRQRGIYRVPVFRSATGFTAAFTLPPRFGSDKRRLVEEPRAEVVFGISDPRGIRAIPDMKLDGAILEPRPGADLGWLRHGFSAALPPGAAGHRVELDGTLELLGTDRLLYLPIGGVTDVELTSDWPHPSFVGAFLPDERSISARGFRAHWRLSRFATGVDDAVARLRDNMGRGVPMATDAGGGASAFPNSDLGVRFVQPVDVYVQSERAVKYGFLFVFLTFVTFFLFEVLRRMAVHPIQYALCGAAVALFFLLLVSLSEHLPFAAAYLIASGACVGLAAFYVGHVLRSVVRGAVFCGLLGALYAFLYIILQTEDYALLLGALLLFAALAIVMIITRRVDWYRLSESPPNTPAGPA
ncbi:MAG TPA: cell envelope integrity protein CreD [Candidatus Eisenbacteria bacterium]|nr:cell envelope integrity protein CreD [Candidatus Eisenbacteria bacterium]